MIHDYTSTQAGTSSASSRRSLSSAGLLVALVALHGMPAQVSAGPLAARAPLPGAAPMSMAMPAPEQAQKPYTLTLTNKDGFIDAALQAQDARLSEIAAELSKRLGGARVHLGPSLREETLTVTVPESALEPMLTSLAPRALVDYELRQGARPVPKDIYLLGPEDPQPKLNTVDRGMSQGLLITGNTEDSTTATEEDALTVIGDKQALTITSKKQPLSTVAMAIADVLGIPVQYDGDGAELVEMDVRGVPAEDLIARVSPNLRLFVRVDLNGLERKLLRLVVASPRTR